MICLPSQVSVKWFAMRRFCTLTATVALLASFLQAPYFHLHGDRASDHARKNHLGQGLTLHTHLFVLPHRAVHFPAIQLLAGRGNDAIFLAWTSVQPHLLSLSVFCPLETTLLGLPDQVADFILLPASHSHDPPFVSSSAPRSPPA